MKARYLTAKERKAAKAVAEMLIDTQAEDIVNRAQCMVYAAALNIGLSVKTVNRMIAELPDVCDGYGKMKREGLADYELIQGLISRGVNVKMTKSEI